MDARIDPLAIVGLELGDRVRESVRAIRESKLVPDRFAASGWVYDVSSGRLRAISI